MPCRFVARGESIRLLVPDGSKSLRQIIQSSLSDVGDNITGRVEGIVSLGDRDCEFALDVSNGRVVIACVDCGEEVLGDEAVKELQKILDEKPSKGYVEAVKLSDAAVGLDMDSAPQAILKNPVTLSELLTTHGEERQGSVEVRGEELSARAVERDEVLKEVNVPASIPPDVVGNSPEVFLANVVVHSKAIDISTNGAQLTSLLSKAKELSSSRTDKVYRLAVSLKSGETYNAFFHNGRPCVLLKHTSLSEGVKRLETNIDEYLGKLPRDNIKYILLCEVTDPLIVRSVENSCTLFPITSTMKVPKENTRKSRRGLLSRILRR